MIRCQHPSNSGAANKGAAAAARSGLGARGGSCGLGWLVSVPPKAAGSIGDSLAAGQSK